jgi:hypothetical protein
MFSAYKEVEGNSFIPDVRKEFMELKHEIH